MRVDPNLKMSIKTQRQKGFAEQQFAERPLFPFEDMLPYPGTQRLLKHLHWLHGKVLDIGCGGGEYEWLLVNHCPNPVEIMAIDFCDNALKWAEDRFGNLDRVTFMKADAHKLPFPDNSFDSVLINHAIEHFEFPAVVVEEAKRVSKLEARFMFLLPNGVTDTGPQHLHFWTTEEFKDFLLGCGMNTVVIEVDERGRNMTVLAARKL